MSAKHMIYIGLVCAITGCGMIEQDPTHPKLLLISFDGFRYDYLSKTETPNFDAFVRQGVISEGLIPVFPTKTFPNHYSIVTGLYPENSGLVGNTMYDPEWDAWYRIGDRSAVENADWYQGEPIWNTAEKQGIVAGPMFWVGSEADIQGMRPTYWKHFDNSMSEEARIDTVLSWLSREEVPADFATLYFELVDNAGHANGPGSDGVVAAIERADQLVGYLMEKLGENDLLDTTDLIIVSDHGMAELAADRVIVLDSLVEMGSIERIIWDPATMIQPGEGQSERVYRELKQNERNYTVFKKEELPARYHLGNHRRVPDLVMVADPGYTILGEENLASFLRGLPAGNHGYDNNSRDMHAFFAARGPAFPAGDTVSAFRNIHLYELMSHIMDIDPAPNDGSLDSIRVLLRQAE